MVPDWRFGLMGLSHSPRIVTNGLVLCVDAANPRSYPGSGSTWYDLGKSKYHGTLVNTPTFVSDKGKSYFQFDGSNERVDFDYLQPAYDSTTDLTWCVWFWYNAAINNTIIIGNRFNSEGTDSPRIFTKLTPTKAEVMTNFGPNVLLSQWQQVIIVKNQSNLFYYRNGELQASSSGGVSKSDTHPFYIAGDQSGEYANVRVNSCQIYDIPFSAEQVRQHYNATKGRFQ